MKQTRTTSRRQKNLATMTLVLLYGLLPLTVTATDYTWNDIGGGNFSDGANWSPAGGPPGGADTALFSSNAAYTVTFTGNTVNTNVWVQDGDVLFDMAGFTYTLDRDDPQPVLVSGSGTQDPILTVSNGVLNDAESGSQRRISIASASDTRGTLRLVNGGRALFNRGTFGLGSTGEATILVDGAGSRLVADSYVQINGDTSIVITNGGYMNLSGAEICGSSGSHLDMLVTGSGSEFYSRNFSLGMRGTAVVRVENGGTLGGWEPYISRNQDTAVAKVTVSGENASFTWTAYLSRRLHIGQQGSGTLILEDGALAYGNAGNGSAATVYADGVLRGPNGTVRTLSGSSGDGELENRGLVAPGGTNRIGTLTVEGHYEQTSTGSLEIKIEGTDTNFYDRLIVEGNDDGHCDVTLNGMLNIVFSDGKPYGGDFDVVTTEGTLTTNAAFTVAYDTGALPGGLPDTYTSDLTIVAEGGLEKLRLTLTPPPAGTLILFR